jgi:hypothetical protein
MMKKLLLVTLFLLVATYGFGAAGEGMLGQIFPAKPAGDQIKGQLPFERLTPDLRQLMLKVPLFGPGKFIELWRKYLNASEIRSRYRLEGASLVMPAPDENGVSVRLGNKDAGVFVPELTIGRWENEVWLMLKPDISGVAPEERELSFDGNRISFKAGSVEYRFYDLPPGREHAEGGYEFEVIFDRRPASNKVELLFTAQGLNFFYQPPLKNLNADGSTWENNGRGGKMSRPENVNGSHAVYHATRRDHILGQKNYKAGKAFHIFRPKVIASNGEWVWAQMDIDVVRRKMTITAPQEFLDRAAYPVIVDPTFGYTTVGGSTWGDAASRIYCTKGTPASTGTVDGITLYSSVAFNFKGILVLNADKTIVTNGIGNATAHGVGAAWVTSTYATSPNVTASTVYQVGMIADVGWTEYYDNGGDGDQNYWETADNSYASPTNPNHSPTQGAYFISHYATYSAASGPRSLIRSGVIRNGTIR